MNRSEFEQSLCVPEFWSVKTKEEVERLLGTDVANMVGYDQKNPHHDMSLMGHALATVEAVPKSETLLRAAAFFHDIGKPYVAKAKGDRLTFHGHAEKSAEIAPSILKEIGYSDDEIDVISFWIRYHDSFMDLKEGAENKDMLLNEENVLATVQRISEAYENAIVFSHADKESVWTKLAILIRADACAHAKITVRDGKVIDTREEKIRRAEIAGNYINNIFKEETL